MEEKLGNDMSREERKLKFFWTCLTLPSERITIKILVYTLSEEEMYVCICMYSFFMKMQPYIYIYIHIYMYAAAAKSLQSCLALCDPVDGSPPGSPVPGILQARTLEWVAISFSNVWKWKVKGKLVSHVWLFATPGLQPTRLLHPWDFPGKSSGVGFHCLLHIYVYVHINWKIYYEHNHIILIFIFYVL